MASASDAGLFHPSIVEPIAAGVEGTVAYRAEEYVAAESLDAAIRHYAPAPLDQALPFLTQLAGAIDFARTAGIGHGSLHLRDIFVTPEEARASGFGVVESLERMGLRAPVRRPYSAPERIAGARWGTPADVFSLAAITYELLTGRRPSGTGDQIGPLTGEHLLEFGAGMRVVLARAMDEDPARRYPTGLAFASALEAAARGGRVTEAVTAVGAITDATIAPAPLSQPEDPEPDLTLAAAAALGATSVADDRGVNVEFDPEPDIAEPDDADAAAERDEDAAHYEIEHAGRDQQDRMVFDDEEAAADLGFDRCRASDRSRAAGVSARASGNRIPSRSRIARGHRTTGIPAHMDLLSEPQTDAYAAGDSVSVDAERPRTAVLPIAVTLILGLLVGFAAGVLGRGRDAKAHRHRRKIGSTERAVVCDGECASRRPEPAKSAATGDAAKPAGKAYSEGTVAQPTATPPVPDEGPRTAPREARTPPPAAAATSGRLHDHVDAVACVGHGERPVAGPHAAHAECDEVRRLLRPRHRSWIHRRARGRGAVRVRPGSQCGGSPAAEHSGTIDASGAFDDRRQRHSGSGRTFRREWRVDRIHLRGLPAERRAHPGRRSFRRHHAGPHPRSQHRLPRRPARADGSSAVDGEYAGLGGEESRVTGSLERIR